MQKNIQVILVPANLTPSGLFLLAVNTEPWSGWVRSDGSFTEGKSKSTEAYEAAGFRTDKDAIAWAESRDCQVINKWMFDDTITPMPPRLTVLVTEANYTPPYAFHETVIRRQQSDESVSQAEIKFKVLDVTTGWGGCYILINQDTVRRFQAAGIRNPAETVGRILVLESDNPSDPTCPLRIVQIQ